MELLKFDTYVRHWYYHKIKISNFRFQILGFSVFLISRFQISDFQILRFSKILNRKSLITSRILVRSSWNSSIEQRWPLRIFFAKKNRVACPKHKRVGWRCLRSDPLLSVFKGVFMKNSFMCEGDFWKKKIFRCQIFIFPDFHISLETWYLWGRKYI